MNPRYRSPSSIRVGILPVAFGLCLSLSNSYADVFVAQQSAAYNAAGMYIRDDQPATNFYTVNAIGHFLVGSGPSVYSPNAVARGLFEFDLTPIETAAAGNPFVINSVTLSVVTSPTTGFGTTTEAFSLYTLGTNSDFNELTVTWNSAPNEPGGSFSDPALSTLSFIPQEKNQTRTFESTPEFTSAVTNALGSDLANTVRFLMKADGELGTYFARFITAENSTTANRPVLRVDYTVTPIPEPSAAMLLVAGAGVGILRRRR